MLSSRANWEEHGREGGDGRGKGGDGRGCLHRRPIISPPDRVAAALPLLTTETASNRQMLASHLIPVRFPPPFSDSGYRGQN